jgi:hypothetical protein
MPQEHPMACEPIRLNHAALRVHARAREALPSTFNPKVAGSIPARPIVAAKPMPRRAAPLPLGGTQSRPTRGGARPRGAARPTLPRLREGQVNDQPQGRGQVEPADEPDVARSDSSFATGAALLGG